MKQSVTNPDGKVTKFPQLRICVTVPCGKRCAYCRPGGEGFPSPRSAEMSLDEILYYTSLVVEAGVTDVKLTGGEPVFRDDIVEIVAGIKRLPGVRSVHMVTRHERAGALAADLRDAGLDVLNFSVDSLRAHTWSRITGVEGHERLIGAVEEAARTGITIKLNTVVLNGVNSDEIWDLIEFAGRIKASLKLLDLIDDIPGFPPSITPEGFSESAMFDLETIVPQLQAEAAEAELDRQPGGLGHPMPRFQMPNGAEVIVKSANAGAWYGSVCEGCPFFPCHDALMALRLTADGKLQYCLLRDDNLIDIRALVEGGASGEALDRTIRGALEVYGDAEFYSGQEVARLRSDGVSTTLPVVGAGR